MKPEDQEEWRMNLLEPYPWHAKAQRKERWSDEDEAAAWVAASSTLGG